MILFQEQLDDFQALAKSAYEEARTLEPKKEEKKGANMTEFLRILQDRHYSLERIQDLYHADDPYIFNRIMGIYE